MTGMQTSVGQGMFLGRQLSIRFYLFLTTLIEETAGMAFDLDQSDLERPLTQCFEQLLNNIKVYNVFGFWVVVSLSPFVQYT